MSIDTNAAQCSCRVDDSLTHLSSSNWSAILPAVDELDVTVEEPSASRVVIVVVVACLLASFIFLVFCFQSIVFGLAFFYFEYYFVEKNYENFAPGKQLEPSLPPTATRERQESNAAGASESSQSGGGV